MIVVETSSVLLTPAAADAADVCVLCCIHDLAVYGTAGHLIGWLPH
jgi:hypothetical protein